MSQFDRIEQSQIEKIAKKVLAGGGGSGTVTSVGSGTGLTGGPITTSGTLSVVYGTSGTSACVGNDSRLSDARTPTAHTHPQSEITDLVSDLAGKAAVSHTHAIADVTGLQTALDGKSAVGHTHAIADVTGLQTALDGKASTSHTHAINDITDVTITAVANDEVLQFTGTVWENQTLAEAGISAVGHTHSAADVTTGTFNIARIPTGTTASDVCIGDDARLSDPRTPTAHTHPLSDLTVSGASSGDVATWNGSAWAPAAPSGGGASALDDLTDVDTTTVAPTQGDILVFDGTNWIPGRARPSVQPISGNRIVGTVASLSLGTQQSTGYNNVLRAFPFLCHRSFSASGLTIACTTAQAATTMEVQLALYEAGDNGWPTGLPIEYMSGSALNGTSVGFKTFTFGSPRTIVANKMYWTASRWLLVSGTAPTWRACTTSSGWELATTSAYNTTTAPYWNINISHTYGSSSAWHNFTTTPITAISQLATSSLPCVWVNVA